MTDSPATPTPTPSPKRRSLVKIILRLFGILVLLVVIGVVALYFMRNTLVRAGVVRGGQYATDQTTLLDAANLSLAAGTLDLSQLQISNPNGYKEPKFLAMKNCNVSVDTGSLLSSTVVINQIDISGLEIFLEQNGAKNNLGELLDIMQKKSPAASTAPASGNSSAPSSPGKQLKINKIRLASTKVHLRGLVSLDLDLGTIEMVDPTNPDGRPMKIADVMVKILLHIAQQIVDSPQLPSDFKNGLQDVTKMVDNLKGTLGKDVGKNLQEALKNVPDLGKGVPDLGKNAGQNLQDLGKNLQGLIPGNKSQPATQPK